MCSLGIAWNLIGGCVLLAMSRVLDEQFHLNIRKKGTYLHHYAFISIASKTKCAARCGLTPSCDCFSFDITNKTCLHYNTNSIAVTNDNASSGKCYLKLTADNGKDIEDEPLQIENLHLLVFFGTRKGLKELWLTKSRPKRYPYLKDRSFITFHFIKNQRTLLLSTVENGGQIMSAPLGQDEYTVILKGHVATAFAVDEGRSEVFFAGQSDRKSGIFKFGLDFHKAVFVTPTTGTIYSLAVDPKRRRVFVPGSNDLTSYSHEGTQPELVSKQETVAVEYDRWEQVLYFNDKETVMKEDVITKKRSTVTTLKYIPRYICSLGDRLFVTPQAEKSFHIGVFNKSSSTYHTQGGSYSRQDIHFIVLY